MKEKVFKKVGYFGHQEGPFSWESLEGVFKRGGEAMRVHYAKG